MTTRDPIVGRAIERVNEVGAVYISLSGKYIRFPQYEFHGGKWFAHRLFVTAGRGL